MIKNRYVKEKLRNTLHHLKNALFEKSPIAENIKDVNKPRVRNLHWYEVDKELWDRINAYLIYIIIFGGEIVRMGG